MVTIYKKPRYDRTAFPDERNIIYRLEVKGYKKSSQFFQN